MGNRVLQIVNVCLMVAVGCALSACETKLEIELPREAPAIVLNSFFWPDYEFELCLSESRDLIDGERGIQVIDDATVELWDGANMVETLPYVGECLYRSPGRRPEPGHEYTLRVSAEGYLDVSASDIAPEPVAAAFEFQVDTEGTDAGSADVWITFHDPPNTSNWYRLIVHHQDPLNRFFFGPPGFRTDDEAISSENQDFIELNDNGQYETVYFSDRLIEHGPNGHRMHLSVGQAAVWGWGSDGELENDDILLVVTLDNISENFFRYATTEWAYRKNGDNPFSEPVKVYSNVENGHGIFGGFSRAEGSTPVPVPSPDTCPTFGCDEVKLRQKSPTPSG